RKDVRIRRGFGTLGTPRFAGWQSEIDIAIQARVLTLQPTACHGKQLLALPEIGGLRGDRPILPRPAQLPTDQEIVQGHELAGECVMIRRVSFWKKRQARI